MERITVGDLATECEVKAQIVINELKQIGVYAVSTTPVDTGIAERIRKRLQLQIEEKKEAEKRQEKAKEKKKKAAPPAPATPRLAAPRKKREPAVEVAETPAPGAGAVSPAAPSEMSLKPRRGLKSYAKVKAPFQPEALVAELEKVVEVTPLTPAEKPEMVEAAKALPEKPGVEEGPPGPAPQVEQLPREKVAEVVEFIPKKKPMAPPPSRPKSQPQILKRTTAERAPVDMTGVIFKKPAAQRPRPEPSRVRRPEKKKGVETPQKVAAGVVVERDELPAELRPLRLAEGITVKDLSERMDVKSKDLIRALMDRGMLATINQTLDPKVAEEICKQWGFEPQFVTFEQEIVEQEKSEDRPEDYGSRSPVVTIMGHVDHGKTSLLDAIRETRVAEKEAGGITQHIGAYKVEVHSRGITFLDTPGHEAFTLMRARGAQVTDIVVLVVAADDGVMPQTIEAIHHARAAHVPIVVAINKIDKSEAQPERVKQQLTDQGLMPEEWGGQTVMVSVSAKQRQNLDLLLEMILLVADLQELKANPKRPALGIVLEAKLDRGRGPVATVLVQNGTLKIGDTFIAGATYGKVRAMIDELGQHVETASPSVPVEVLGFEEVPLAGDQFLVVDDPAKVKQIGAFRQAKLREQTMTKTARLSLEHLFERMKEGEVQELPIVLKTDVHGSAEVLADMLIKLGTEKVKVRVIHSGVGAITESDVLLASASNAIIVGFNVRPDGKAADLAASEGVDIRLHTVIYNVAGEIRDAMTGLLQPTFKEKHIGAAEVRQTFNIPKAGTVAGSYVTDGFLKRDADVRLLRDHVVVYEGKIKSLRRFKDDVNEVRSGYECGIGLDRFNDVKVGDVIEAFVMEKVQPTL